MNEQVKHAYWIHEKIKNENSVSGFIYKRECTCSNCGKEVNMEKEKCPYCGAVMDAENEE